MNHDLTLHNLLSQNSLALFRLFDIMKPFPVDWAERRFNGALGIMADDILAAVYAGIGTGFIYAYAHGIWPFSA